MLDQRCYVSILTQAYVSQDTHPLEPSIEEVECENELALLDKMSEKEYQIIYSVDTREEAREYIEDYWEDQRREREYYE